MIEHILLLDVLKQGCQQHLAGFKAGETCVREIGITLSCNGKTLKLCDGAHAELYIIRPDGCKCHSTCEIDTKKNKISHVMTTGELAVPGRLECEIRIQFPAKDSGVIPVMYSPCFDIMVENTIYSENAVISDNENSEWSQTLQRINNAEDRLEVHEKSLLEKANKTDLYSKADKADLELKADKTELGDKVSAAKKTSEMTAEVGIDEDGKLWFDPRAWEELEITSFSVTPSGFVEKGATVDNITVSWKANKKDVTAVLYLSGVEKGRYTPEDGGNDKTVTLENLNIAYNPSAASPTVSLTVYNSSTAIGKVQRSQTVKYANRIYMGTAAIPAYIDSVFIRSLEKSKLSAARSMTETVTAGEGEYIWYACPAAGYGTPSFKLGNPFEGGAEKAGEIMLTNASGYSEVYQVWRSVNSGLGTMKVEVI